MTPSNPSLIEAVFEALLPANEHGGGDITKPFHYLAGKMTGWPKFNFPAFDAAASILRQNGYNIVNPAQFGTERERMLAYESTDGMHETFGPDTPTWADCLRRDVPYVLNPHCRGVILLDDWENSRGARVETYNAHMMGLPIYRLSVVDENDVVLTEIDRFDELRAAGVEDR